MNILVLNQDWFVEEFRAAGHQAWSCGLAAHLDIPLETPLLHIDTVIRMIPGGAAPDVIIVMDNSSPVTFNGLEETPIPVIFYSVDTHHHLDWHKYLFNVFDYTLVAQKDYIPAFQELGNSPEWMPLWASRFMEPSDEIKHDAVFVGNLDPALNPDRVEFFRRLAEKVPVLCMTGEFWKIFPHSRIVINQTVRGDLNFRVFEAMMSGAMLLTERSGNGLSELFIPDLHMVTYEKGDVNEAAEKLRYYLANEVKRREIAQAGRAQILQLHTPGHRADKFLKIASEIEKKDSPQKFFSALANFATLGRKAESLDGAFAAKSFVSALKCCDSALSRNEKLDTELACFSVYACLKYDQYIKSGAGYEMLVRLSQQYPGEAVFKVARIRHCLNAGRRDEAEAIAREFKGMDLNTAFARAEEVIINILGSQAV